MSLYNMVCGNNPLFGLYARVIETVAPFPDVARFRDIWTRQLDDGSVQIVLHTRTGGGNREDYVDANLLLEQHPLFVETWDDDFDSTFANFAFRVPDEHMAAMQIIHQEFSKHPKGCAPSEKFKWSLRELEGKSSPEPLPIDSELLANTMCDLMAKLPDQSSLEKQLQPFTRVTG